MQRKRNYSNAPIVNITVTRNSRAIEVEFCKTIAYAVNGKKGVIVKEFRFFFQFRINKIITDRDEYILIILQSNISSSVAYRYIRKLHFVRPHEQPRGHRIKCRSLCNHMTADGAN